MSKAKSGGGITSNKVVQSRGVVPGAKAKAVSPQSAARIGTQVITTTSRDTKMQGPGAPIAKPLGNELAKSVGQGPGAGRTIHGCGSQGRHGGKE